MAPADKSVKMHPMDFAFWKGSFPDEMRMPEPNISAVLFYDTAPPQQAIIDSMKKHMWPHRRFSSRIKDGYWLPREERMDEYHHFYETTLENSEQIDYFVQCRMVEPMHPDYPPWRFFILRNKTGRDAVLFRVSHACGDGLSLLFASAPAMDCEGGNMFAKMPLPEAMLPPSMRQNKKAKELVPSSANCFAGIKNCLRGCITPLIAAWDDELSINEPLKKRQPNLQFSGDRAWHRLPPIPLSLVKTIAKKHGGSVNDVMMAALAGAFRKYGAVTLGDAKLQKCANYTCTALMLMALPRPIDEATPANSMCNNIIFGPMRLPVGKDSPLERLADVKKTTADLKSKEYMCGLIGITQCLTGIIPFKALQKVTGEAFSKPTFCVTSVPAPSVPLKFPKDGGAEIVEIQLALPNVMTQLSIISYCGYFYLSISADPNVMKNVERLDDFWTAEFEILEAC
eukprot:gnl/MRDRNA2_/MRDRNA2_29562_c0_seq1.p1 gnl/MRDRNA2_/MRDRNA2_29562_c0~~gnl/MRDRNA2_/MRDRNA2_29562_c0_seq1.p1  ORF type:complete len:455 (+),score=88.32 gnl/MRDRNA2_/MRDRNA2_29562_c0_seq1:110-1474(+)